jgi:CRP-like cAMP-binding protein
MSAKQRYDFLLQTNPAIIQRLSNKIVASYLGITQESLSRIKAQK